MMQKEMNEVKGETLIVHLPEELDHHTVEIIRESTDQLFMAKKIRDVVFDYTFTHFMDSSGIGLVMGRYREVRYLRGDIYIACVNDKVSRILEISGLYRVAKTAGTVEEALDCINAKVNCG